VSSGAPIATAIDAPCVLASERPSHRDNEGRLADPSRFFAPGRVNLIGEYTDLAAGLALPAAIDLGVTLTVEPADELSIVSDEGDLSASVAAVVAELGGAEPCRGVLTSTLPIGAGLSSSAAVHVVLTLALGRLEGLELAGAAQRAEHRALGVPSGILDQAACVLGRAGHAVLLDFDTLAYEHVPLPEGLAIVVVDSGVARRNSETGYAARKRELAEGMPSRVRHIATENERVRAVAAALRADDRAALGTLFREGHDSLRDDFEVTTPELDRLVELAYANGAVAARMTGGGFGGAIVALVDASDAERFAARMPGRSWVTQASAGAREL
jgi:galactokinase